ncbi:hypothetical protein LBMAG42_41630 [Deltaproteobacteria bacterium]|nr:hypothetical protein LBMAG42_41630 [Deltaproteobacteria bacterium]
MRPFFARIRAWVAARLAAEGEGTGLELSILVLALAGHVGHYLTFCLPQPWYIEDSAISFAYARNWVDGFGLVPFVGAEHVEGYSNPLWTYLIGIWYAVGVSPWTSSKVMGAVFGCVAQLFTWGFVRRTLPREKRWVALLAPWFLAGSTQFALWNASGLENSLFCMLLAVGIYRLLVEVENDDKRPWSALAFFLLTMTRPDGLAYAGIGLIARTMGTVARRQWVAWLFWGVAFAIPWVAYFEWRMAYFAWEWPQTWYAKKKDFHPENWNSLGWKQMREYTWNYGIIWAAPLIAMAVAGFDRWRKWLVLGLLAAMTFVVLWDGKMYIPGALKGPSTVWLASHWISVRVGTLGAVAAILGLASFGQKGWFLRGTLWCCYSFGLFYTVLASGDWMKAYRWYSLTSVPQFALITLGLAEFMDLLPLADLKLGRLRLSGVYAVVPAIALIAVNPYWSYKFVIRPETAPRDVHKRADYMTWVQSRLDLDRVTLFDVDMGAHLWYTDWFIADIAGLVDVPMAQHEYEKAFLKEYLFEEVRPTFAHVHGSWKNTIHMDSHEEWPEQYIEIPGYPSGKHALHVGNHVRKDILVNESPPPNDERLVRFGDGVRLETWSLPAPVVAPGGELFVDSRWRAAKRDSGLRVLLFLSKNGAVAWSGEVAPGYDWYRADRWEPWEYVRGGWSVAMPGDLALGDYQLGMVLLDEKAGVVLPFAGTGPGGTPLWGDEPAAEPVDLEPAKVPDPDAPPGDGPVAGLDAAAPPPLYMVGEYVFPEVVHIVSNDDAHTAATSALEGAKASAAAGDCETAQAKWKNARRHVASDSRWKRKNQDEAQKAIVSCLLARAKGAEDPLVAATIVFEARFIDPKSELLAPVGGPIGERLDAAGVEAAARKDWQEAYEAFRGAVQADPTRALSRRRAEDVRDRRLKIRAYDTKKGTKDRDLEPLP